MKKETVRPRYASSLNQQPPVRTDAASDLRSLNQHTTTTAIDDMPTARVMSAKSTTTKEYDSGSKPPPVKNKKFKAAGQQQVQSRIQEDSILLNNSLFQSKMSKLISQNGGEKGPLSETIDHLRQQIWDG